MSTDARIRYAKKVHDLAVKEGNRRLADLSLEELADVLDESIRRCREAAAREGMTLDEYMRTKRS